MADPEPSTITREDIEQGLRSVHGDVIDSAHDQTPRLVPVVIGLGVLALILAFLAGRRIGRTRSTVVEIRRI
jgi:hypothetical protein